jgi:hypothetical protein
MHRFDFEKNIPICFYILLTYLGLSPEARSSFYVTRPQPIIFHGGKSACRGPSSVNGCETKGDSIINMVFLVFRRIEFANTKHQEKNKKISKIYIFGKASRIKITIS